jgi:hypothetical protein
MDQILANQIAEAYMAMCRAKLRRNRHRRHCQQPDDGACHRQGAPESEWCVACQDAAAQHAVYKLAQKSLAALRRRAYERYGTGQAIEGEA